MDLDRALIFTTSHGNAERITSYRGAQSPPSTEPCPEEAEEMVASRRDALFTGSVVYLHGDACDRHTHGQEAWELHTLRYSTHSSLTFLQHEFACPHDRFVIARSSSGGLHWFPELSRLDSIPRAQNPFPLGPHLITLGI